MSTAGTSGPAHIHRAPGSLFHYIAAAADDGFASAAANELQHNKIIIEVDSCETHRCADAD